MESQSEAKPPTGSVDGNLAIGIDLGTWKCCVGVVREGKVEIIENERGSKTTPSYVAFTGTERLVGEDARLQATVNCANTVFGVKRIIGRSFDDSSLQNDVNAVFPFTVGNDNGKPVVEVTYRGEKKQLFPEQVSAMLLVKMKRIAESHLGCQVRDAVISVPAYFNNAQRQATKDAGAIAGLSVLGLINEPSAAALAYRDNKGPTDETICLVDLGGGTLDVSIIRMEGNKGISVLKTQGNTSFGGMDLDQRLVAHFEKEFMKENSYEIFGNKASERLRLACEKLKHTLSLLPTGKIQLDCLAKSTDLESSIARDTFNSLCYEDFEQSLHSVLVKILQLSEPEGEQQAADIFNKVVLVGGSTRIPFVQELLKNVLGKGLDKSVNPDEAVAHGAAIKAALLGKESSLPDMAVREVSAHTYVMESEHSHRIIFHQNSSQTVRKFCIPSVEDFNARYNLIEILFDIASKTEVSRRLIGSVMLSDLSEHITSEILFSIDDCGVFGGEIVVGKDRWLFHLVDSCPDAGEQLTVMCNQEEEFRADEEREMRRLVSLSDLEGYCFRNKPLIEVVSAYDREDEEIKQAFIKLCDDTIDWLDCTPEATEDDCKGKKEKLVAMHDCLILPPPLPDVVDDLHNVCAAPCTEPTIDPNAGWTKVGRKTIGEGSETKTRRGVGDHPLRDTSLARAEGERVHVPPVQGPGYQGDEQTDDPFAPWGPDDPTYPVYAIPNPDVDDRIRGADRDSFNAANNDRAVTSTANKRPLGFGTGRNTAARAERRLREAVPVHGPMKVVLKRGNHPFPDDTQPDRQQGDATRNDRAGTSSGGDIQIQMCRRDSNSNVESDDQLMGGAEDQTRDKPSILKRMRVRTWMRKTFLCSRTKKRSCPSEEEEKHEMKWC